MRALGLDVGERRIGVAVSDTLGIAAGRLVTIERRGLQADLEALRELIHQQAVEVVVVGIPLSLRGGQGPQARRVQAFAEALQRRIGVPIEFVDERLTTVQGTRALIETGLSARRRKAVVDQVAAQLILQQYLETRRAR